MPPSSPSPRRKSPSRPCSSRRPRTLTCRAAASSSRPRSITSAAIPAGVSASTSAPRPGASATFSSPGARRVYAVDVGRGQLHASLRAEPRLLSIEGTDIRALAAARLPEAPDFVTIDVSFISLKLVLPATLRLAQGPAQLLALIKPQFE